jgi:hypothetical protein
MEAMRETWTDARLSDFAAHTDDRFDAVDRRFEALERRFDTVDRRFEAVDRRMDDGFRALNTRFDALQRTMLQLGGGVIVALIGLIATQL